MTFIEPVAAGSHADRRIANLRQDVTDEINRLFTHAYLNPFAGELRGMLDRILDHMAYLFEMENALLDRSSSVGDVNHRRDHQSLIDELIELRVEIERYGYETGAWVKVFYILTEKIADHFELTDA